MKCPKCGATKLYRNEDGDLECLCGKIIYTEQASMPSAVATIKLPNKKQRHGIPFPGHYSKVAAKVERNE